ncbi:efflux RND transporter periplasmic adaptor subunit [Halospina sp. K52047b]|uniref:efflux RND transporter periplasmic adaptor subunit n=1 Tax=Halospina sp. K52047b TaxID=2614160 RepID=UPI001249C5F0|nr:efflux RND transporter periplasmic adaptor subunit [Halospina sp. K52047b]KAA8985478.1 efflux RND transporter periplasmic adaptor subunit [Halospina sp. K52047b]
MNEPINDSAARPETGRAGRIKTAFISLAILVLGAALVWLVFRTEPTATRGPDTARETAMLVDVTTAEKGDYHPTITAMGQVRAARELTLRPRVSGQIVERASAFTPGGMVDEGDMLVRIDPADYEATLQQRRSELRQARADLDIEQGRQNVAEQEFELLGEELEGTNKALVLRQPQLEQARAQVESAKAALRQAQLNLDRTSVTAPFNARVLSRDISLGTQVNAGEALGRLVGVDEYWVEATVPQSELPWLRFEERSGEAGAPATIRNDSAWPQGQHREGQLQRLVGELNEDTRLARVLITVQDPLALDADSPDKPPLLIGSFLNTAIEGREIQDVVRLDRNHIRRNDTVWVMEDGALSIRDVAIAFRDAEYAYVSKGVEDGEAIVTSDLATVVDGADLRTEEDDG